MSQPIPQYNIINLSSYPLTADEISVLAKGLTFCPNRKINKFKTIKDLHLFTRKLQLQSMFDKADVDSSTFSISQRTSSFD